MAESPIVLIGTESERTPGCTNLCYGESDMPTPDFICRAADDAVRAGHTFYTHTAGTPELRETIAAKVFALHGAQYRSSEIIGTVGASTAIYLAIRAFVGPGDNAVIISPAYPIYVNAVTMAGAEPRAVPLARDGKRFRLDLDRVQRAIDKNTRMLIINSPSNPTGCMITAQDQRGLYELAERYDLMILADEVYERLVYDTTIAPSFSRIAEAKDRLIVANSLSKTYNMTGWRLGWAQASEATIRVMYSAAEFITSNPTAMVQQAGVVALRDGESYVNELRAHYTARRAQVQAELGGIPGVSLSPPDGGFFSFMRIDGLEDSSALAMKLVREAKVALAPGSAFGASGEGYLRLCFAAAEATLMPALARLREYLVGN